MAQVNLDDSKSLAEVKVENDAVLAVVFKLNGTCGDSRRVAEPSA